MTKDGQDDILIQKQTMSEPRIILMLRMPRMSAAIMVHPRHQGNPRFRQQPLNPNGPDPP